MGVVGIVLSLVLLMVLAYSGINVIVLAPMMALLAVVFDPAAPVLASYTQIFMPALGRFIASYFPLFLLGAIFGKLLEDSGCTAAIAGHGEACCEHQPADPANNDHDQGDRREPLTPA